MLGASLGPQLLGLHGELTLPRDQARWLDTLTDANELVLRGEGEGLVARLARAGWRRATLRSLVTHGHLAGVVMLAQRSSDAMAGRHADLLEALAPLLAAQISLSRQRDDLLQAAAAIDELFDASPNMMCVLDRLGRIERTNQRFRNEIGVPGDLVGMPLSWLVHPAWVDRFEQLWQRIVTEGHVDQERVDLITASTERLPLAFEAHWLKEAGGTHRLCMVALWNVSAHVEREARSRQRIDDLSQFAHHVAHDLKAPLRTIAGFTALLIDGLPQGANAELAVYGARIESAAERAGDLVTGLLQFAQSTESDGSRSQVVTLSHLLDDVCEQLAGDLEARHCVPIIVEDDSAILGHTVSLATLLGNLVGNALRYSDGDAPRIDVGVHAEAPGWCSLWVGDAGPGIALEHQDEIFGLFRRGATDKPGTGVGLAVVRRIARAHGGEVTVESALGVGSTFRVRLPTP